MKNTVTWLVFGFTALVLTGCGSSDVPRGVKLGKPYMVNGVVYKPRVDIEYDKTGTASWYGPGFHGKRTATGEQYNQHALTAAHPTLPMPSLVRVTNLANGRNVIVRINDRGPFKSNRIIDLSRGSAEVLGIKGLAQVRVQYLAEETAEYIAGLGVEVPREMQVARKRSALSETGGSNDLNDADDSEGTYPDGQVSDETLQVAPLQAITQSDIDAPTPGIISQAAAEEPVKQIAPPPHRSDTLQYFIQVGAFGLEANAGRMAEQLRDIGKTSVLEAHVSEKVFYRVRLGPLANRAEAEMALEKIRQNGLMDAKIILN